MKEALLHLLFIAVVVFSASFLKKDTESTSLLSARVQDSAVATPTLALVQDTTTLRIRK
jgi:hypothetical protein